MRTQYTVNTKTSTFDRYRYLSMSELSEVTFTKPDKLWKARDTVEWFAGRQFKW